MIDTNDHSENRLITYRAKKENRDAPSQHPGSFIFPVTGRGRFSGTGSRDGRQCECSVVLREMIDKGEISLVGAMYDVNTGKVTFM